MSKFEKAVTGLGEECGVFGAYAKGKITPDMMWQHPFITDFLPCSTEDRRAVVLQ